MMVNAHQNILKNFVNTLIFLKKNFGRLLKNIEIKKYGKKQVQVGF